MPDRKMVIDHLVDCLSSLRPDSQWAFVRRDIIEVAIALLKEQEPVKPQYVNVRWRDVPRCGACGVGLLDCEDNYCHYCGRKVKWE